MDYEVLPREELIKLLLNHDKVLAESGKDGIIMSYTGRTAPWQITRQVKPKLNIIKQELCFGEEASQAQNIIMEGENLSAMVTLYKYKGQVDLILTDPPYNTGEDFRYNDKWDKDPNDPDLGTIVPKDDGSKHSKWLKFMTPRLWMMKDMLKPDGVIAICIDHRELFRLGMLMDEIFNEDNRIGIINWQKSYAPRNDNKHLSTATEYVLVYAKDYDRSKTRLTERTKEMNARYKNQDNDPYDVWKPENPIASEFRQTGTYAIQSPFTGKLYYPSDGRSHWANDVPVMKKWLEGWNSKYQRKDIGDGYTQALVIKGCKFKDGKVVDSDQILNEARHKALLRLEEGAWPQLYFGITGDKGPQIKRYLKDVKKGKVSMTYWADEEYDTPEEIDSQSWDHEESGHSQTGINELDAIVGANHNFKTVKPLKLFRKIIQIWCRPDGIVLDPFAGSGTTGHAVIELNHQAIANRKFILIEQGNAENGDHYARTLTADRVRRVLAGDWASGPREPLSGGFRFIEMLKQKIDASAVNALAREEMIDLLLTSYWDKSENAKSYIGRYAVGENRYLFGVNPKNEGFFLVWDSPDKPSVLNREVFVGVVQEAKAQGLSSRYHVYATVAPYTGQNVEFYKIPDRVLEHIGFNARSDAYNNELVEESDV